MHSDRLFLHAERSAVDAGLVRPPGSVAEAPTIRQAVSARPAFHFRQPSVVPGFGLSLGVTLAYLSLIVLL
ncbi:hypothetical protein GGR05_004455, partial [Aureimonas phyllosphaerae]|nr:hypothetical protein [Aureimonas phyllosphaerae]MBB3962291.1 hypothetical protein [Aureimonas phyllosphaerae]